MGRVYLLFQCISYSGLRLSREGVALIVIWMLWFVSKKVGHPVADMKLAKGEGLSADGRMPCHERARLITEVGGGGEYWSLIGGKRDGRLSASPEDWGVSLPWKVACRLHKVTPGESEYVGAIKKRGSSGQGR